MSTLAYIEQLQQELNALEAKMLPNLLPAAQEALDDEWEHLMCEMEMLLQIFVEDDRGCENCAGCMYCEESSPYEDSDEL